MEEHLLSAVKLEVYLPSEPVKLASDQIDFLKKARRRKTVCQGESINAYLVVNIPEGENFKGRPLKDFSHFYRNLVITVQILVEGRDGQPHRALPSARSSSTGTIARTTKVESSTLGGEWSEVRYWGTLPPIAQCDVEACKVAPLQVVDDACRVMYRMETAMAVDRKLVDTPLLLRISIAPPTFPLDEATLHNSSLYETTAVAESLSRCMHGISSMSANGKGPGPTYFIDVKLKVVDPVDLRVQVSCVGEKAVVVLTMENVLADGAVMVLEKVVSSHGDLTWECSPTTRFPLSLHPRSIHSLVASIPLHTLIDLPSPPSLVTWWRNSANRDHDPDSVVAHAASSPIVKMVSLQEAIEASGISRANQISISIRNRNCLGRDETGGHSQWQSGDAFAVVDGVPTQLIITLTNKGPRRRELTLEFPMLDKQGLTSLIPMSSTIDYDIEAGQSISRSLTVRPTRRGLITLDKPLIIDKQSSAVYTPQHQWTCLSLAPGEPLPDLAGGQNFGLDVGDDCETATQVREESSQPARPSRRDKACHNGGIGSQEVQEDRGGDLDSLVATTGIEKAPSSCFLDVLSPEHE